MNKIKSILTEEYADDNFILKLQYDCAPFFQENYLGNNRLPMYRGIRKTINEYKVIKPRKNREPMDMPIEIHKMLDAEFKKKFGWKPRSQGVFAFGEKTEAYGYGFPYICIPIGKFEFVWSPEIKDLYVYMFNFGLVKTKKVASTKDEYEPAIKNIVNMYTNKDFYGALESKHEIMIKCDKYYMINENYLDIHYSELFSR